MDLKEAFQKALQEGGPRVVFHGDNSLWDGRINSGHLHIIETEPLFRTVKMIIYEGCHCDCCRAGQEGKKYIYTLAMPYMQFYCSSFGNRVTWSLEPLQHYEQMIGLPLLPNVYGLGNICLGHLAEIHAGNDAVKFCHFFWNTTFTPNELKWYYQGRIEETTLKSFDHWHEMSKKASDPMKVFENFEYPHQITYRQLSLKEQNVEC